MADMPDKDPLAANGHPAVADSHADRADLERRVRELSAENERLRAELAHVSAKLVEEEIICRSLMLEGMPATQQELDEALAEPRFSLADVIREIEEASGRSS